VLQVFETVNSLAEAAAKIFISSVREAVAERGQAIVALSGGSSPKVLYALLAAEPNRSEIDWTRVTFLWGDERYVPPSDPQSNERMARETLLNRLDLAPSQVFSMYRGNGPSQDAAHYERRLLDLFSGRSPNIDLLLLGMGADGHTLSLFPSYPAVHENTRWVIEAQAPVNAPDRITLTPVIANAARRILFMVTGADKADALARCLEGPLDFDVTPSQAIARVSPNVDWLVDSAAAANLTH
jgi:6-phosphogluconolactonase